jgi:hypothetical protein
MRELQNMNRSNIPTKVKGDGIIVLHAGPCVIRWSDKKTSSDLYSSL